MINRILPYPTQPGTYLLIFDLDQALDLVVGRLGACHLPSGRWLYAGSALGPGGLAGRIGRHMRGPALQHWHVDYLTTICVPREVVYAPEEHRLECLWVEALRTAGATAPIRGFGNSDCRRAGCPAHLLHLPAPLTIEEIEDLIWTTSSGVPC